MHLPKHCLPNCFIIRHSSTTVVNQNKQSNETDYTRIIIFLMHYKCKYINLYK